MTTEQPPPAPARVRGSTVVAATAALVLVIALTVLVVAARQPDALTANDAPTSTAPADTAVLAPGGWPEVAAYVRVQSEAGRPTVVKFFASWCEPCVTETPLVLDVAARNPDVAWLGVAHEDRPDPAADFVDDIGLRQIPTVLDSLGETARTVGVLGMPGVAFFDGDGVLVGVHIGPVTEPLLHDLLAALRAGEPLPQALR